MPQLYNVAAVKTKYNLYYMVMTCATNRVSAIYTTLSKIIIKDDVCRYATLSRDRHEYRIIRNTIYVWRMPRFKRDRRDYSNIFYNHNQWPLRILVSIDRYICTLIAASRIHSLCLYPIWLFIRSAAEGGQLYCNEPNIYPHHNTTIVLDSMRWENY